MILLPNMVLLILEVLWYTFECIFLNNNCCILIQISLKFVPNVPIYIKSALIKEMAWCQTGKNQYCPNSLMPYGNAKPQWVNTLIPQLLPPYTSDVDASKTRARFRLAKPGKKMQ